MKRPKFPLPPYPPQKLPAGERETIMSNSRKSQKPPTTTPEKVRSNSEVPFRYWDAAPPEKPPHGTRALYLLALEPSHWVATEALQFILKEDDGDLTPFMLTNDERNGWWIFSHNPVTLEFQGLITGYIARLREEEKAKQENP